MAKPKEHNVDFTATKKVKEPTEVDPHSPVLLIHKSWIRSCAEKAKYD